MYQLSDVLDKYTMQSKRDCWYLIGKDFELHNVGVGRQVLLQNISDSHIYHRVTKTSVIENIKDSLKEISLVAKDTIYILRKI
jgi:hypothetical protein